MKLLTSLGLVICLCKISPVNAYERSDSSVHTHGEVIFNVLKTKYRLQVLIKAPGMDVVGFENAPKTKDQINAFTRVLNVFKHPPKVINLSQSAGCKLTNQRLVHSLAPDKEVSRNYETNQTLPQQQTSRKKSHSEFLVEYSFLCKKTNRLNTMHIHWFKPFPFTKTITVNISTEQGQSSHKLFKNDPIINF